LNVDKYFSLYERERIKIDEKLAKALKNRKPSSLYEPGNYILEGSGKRLRPLLVLFSAKAVGLNFNKVYNAALAVEMLHNFTLVHDDIMDNADKRRGRLTLHKKYDINTAILVGDSLLSIAYEFLLKDAKGSRVHEIIKTFNKGLIEVCEGQSLDKEFEIKSEVTLNEYLTMITKKTAALAEMCCTIGGQLGNCSKEEIKILANFGKKIGIAFQIQDDLLDISGTTAELGKNIGGDLIEGKKTFLFIKALEKANLQQKRNLFKIVKNKGISPSEINFYKSLYEELGVLDDAKKEIIKYTKSALKGLGNLKNEDDKNLFTWLANSLIKRNK
jgi:geranylgeranyl diphosphate synthase type II